jgi:integrase
LATGLLERTGPGGQPLSKHSVHAYMRAVNGFLRWSAAEGEEVKARAQLPKLPRRLIDILSREEIARMEDAAKAERDKLVVRLLADTGIRVGELVALRPADLIPQARSNFIKVQGKGAQERLVPVPPASSGAYSATQSASARGTRVPIGCSSVFDARRMATTPP